MCVICQSSVIYIVYNVYIICNMYNITSKSLSPLRHMMQYVGYVYTGGLLYSAAPVHSIGTLHDWCASARADMFTVSLNWAVNFSDFVFDVNIL